MKTEIENNINEDKKTRATRADLEAMQSRFDALVYVMRWWVDAGGDLPLSHAAMVYSIARGATLDKIILEAGRAALGLEG
jgi:hypothetical protein